MIPSGPICTGCKHYNDGDTVGILCGAFPQGIPDAILLHGEDHRQPFPGDHGIQFEPREETEEAS